MHVVVVTFEIESQHWKEFRKAVLENAAKSLDEVGCRKFDVSEDTQRSTILLYELYTDASAFEKHLSESHFHEFANTTSSWVRAKAVARFELIGSNDPI
jgi:autoinducer 2-degrading protein